MKKKFDIYSPKHDDSWKKVKDSDDRYFAYADIMIEEEKHSRVINLKTPFSLAVYTE